jgi:phosphonate transport system substrate-binding protein
MKKVVLTLLFIFMSISIVAAAEPLKIGVAAMISPKETAKYYKKIIDYVGEKLGIPVEMVQKESYDEMDKLLKKVK